MLLRLQQRVGVAARSAPTRSCTAPELSVRSAPLHAAPRDPVHEPRDDQDREDPQGSPDDEVSHVRRLDGDGREGRHEHAYERSEGWGGAWTRLV